MIRVKQQWSAVSEDGSGLDGFVNASVSQRFCFGLRSQLPPAFPMPILSPMLIGKS
jgi:hypothetical protein